ncbi:MAG: 2-C-methyl-D-erythritol 2,4-cyclodiphosphate synthase, partial [Deltaproteobacteria bacterium]|nr:2-C-methyl-D-erythritol 2,4-cyclodiphosphate synthase [Deltaproteobacteria bacterium]
KNHDNDVTDESTLLEQANIPVRLVAGEQTNIKITTPEDLNLANVIMNSHSPVVRIGHGFDAHRFEKGRELILGGVKIDFGLGLAGHSDADVLTHALCDAILGACGLGDLGRHFPDNDNAFKDISSLILLKKVISLAAAEKFKLANADMTIVCQVPKIAPFVKEMRENIAKYSLTDMTCISIKATTTEHMGFTGRKEGMSCHAVVLLEQL